MIGENIKRLMKENGYTQKQLAIRSQCTESAISKYINNKREPSIEILKNLAISLGVTVGELISERKSRTNFDKITSSVESLAECIDMRVCGICDNCPVNYDEECTEPHCVDNIKNWLLKECN